MFRKATLKILLFFFQAYVAIYDYTAADDDEITINEGDRLTDVTVIDEGWMEGTNTRSGKYGMFPSNYVQKVWPDDGAECLQSWHDFWNILCGRNWSQLLHIFIPARFYLSYIQGWILLSISKLSSRICLIEGHSVTNKIIAFWCRTQNISIKSMWHYSST